MRAFQKANEKFHLNKQWDLFWNTDKTDDSQDDKLEASIIWTRRSKRRFINMYFITWQVPLIKVKSITFSSSDRGAK